MCSLLSPIPKENEVSVDAFLKLKEIDSLSKMRINHLKAKHEQEDRLSKLNGKRHEAHMQTAKLKQDLITLHSDMAEIDKKLKTSSEQKQRLIDIGGDEKKIEQFETEITTLENKGFEFLEEADACEKEMADLRTFINGLEKTITEIEAEVILETNKINHEVENLDFRLKLLLEELPQDFRSILERVSSKHLAHGPFTRIDQGSCFFCRYKISRIDESEIDMHKGLKTCPQCGRIFLPYGAS